MTQPVVTGAAEQMRDRRRANAAPGGAHDRLVHVLWSVLPMGVGATVAVMLVTPERHALPPPLLLNAMSWLASVRERNESPLQAFRGKPFAIASVSERNDGIYAALTLRQMLTAGFNAAVIAPQLIVARGVEAFDRMDRLQDDNEFAAMQNLVRALIDAAQRMM